MKRKDVDLFEKLVAQLDGFYQDLSVLVKKNQNDAVNAFKLNLINNVLQQCNILLGNKYRPFPDFETFSLDAVPSNSDVTFIISQYIECAEKFRSDHIHNTNVYRNEWYWQLDDDKELRTAPPKKIKN
jgi:hypothetical protein